MLLIYLSHTQYDAKLLKLQKQSSSRAQSSTAASSSVNNEIFRKVLAFGHDLH